MTADDGTVGVALGFLEASRHRVVAALTRRLSFDALPVVISESELADRFVALIEDYARKLGVVDVAFRSYGGRGTSEPLRARRYDLRDRLEFELSLAGTEEQLWSGLSPRRRRNVNKSRKAGVLIETMPADLGLSTLFQLHEVTRERIRSKGTALDSAAPSREHDAPERELLDSGAAKIVGARIGDRWISACLFVEFDRQVYHRLSGHLPQAYELQAPTLLFWESMRLFRNNGALWFNLGGCSASARDPASLEHGLMQFKQEFGGREIEIASGSKVLRPARFAVANAIRSALQ